MRHVSLDRLETLIAAADLGSLAEAARVLHLSPPTVSLHLQELESRVGTPLLERGHGQTRLTPAGEVLVSRGRHLLQGCRDMLERTRKRGLGLAGTLRLAATAGVEPELLPRLIDALESRIPGADVRLDAHSSRESVARIQAGLLDLAIVALPIEAGPDIELVRWRSDTVCAFIPDDWKAQRAVTAHWLAQRPWMSFAAGTQLHSLIAAWFADAGLEPMPRYSINQADGLLALVDAGKGAALLPSTASTKGKRVAKPLSPAAWRHLAIALRKREEDLLVLSGVQALMTLKPAQRRLVT